MRKSQTAAKSATMLGINLKRWSRFLIYARRNDVRIFTHKMYQSGRCKKMYLKANEINKGFFEVINSIHPTQHNYNILHSTALLVTSSPSHHIYNTMESSLVTKSPCLQHRPNSPRPQNSPGQQRCSKIHFFENIMIRVPS